MHLMTTNEITTLLVLGYDAEKEEIFDFLTNGVIIPSLTCD